MKQSMYQILNAIDAMCGPENYDQDFQDLLAESQEDSVLPKSLYDSRYTLVQALALIEFGVQYVVNTGSGQELPHVPFLDAPCRYIEVWADVSGMPQEHNLEYYVRKAFPNEEILTNY